MGAVAADALDGQVLDGAQELGLRGQGQVGDFVEKQRAAVGVLELAAAAAHARRRALLDAEELGLEQRLDERRAIDGDERTVPAPAQVVDLTGDELLADAALAFEQHGEIRVRATRSIVSAASASRASMPISGGRAVALLCAHRRA